MFLQFMAKSEETLTICCNLTRNCFASVKTKAANSTDNYQKKNVFIPIPVKWREYHCSIVKPLFLLDAPL